MRKFLIPTFILAVLLSFSSCAVIESLLGYDECIYPGCTKTQVSNCNYCIDHCNVGDYNLPDNFTKQTKQSIDKQVGDYNKRRNKE